MGFANDEVERIATQIDGKIVCAGYSENSSGNSDFAILRYNPDGTLDTTFNGTGKLLLAIGPGEDYATGLAIQPDGKILVSGISFNGTDDDIAVIRLNADGSIDSSFGTGGTVRTSVRGWDRGFALALQYDGKIVVAGFVYSLKGSGMVLVRYNPDGALDAGFGNAGIVEDAGDIWDFAARDLKVQPDGKIVVAGEGFTGASSFAVFALARFLPGGAPDTTFNNNGKIFTQIGTDFSRAYSLALGENGTILVGGSSSNIKERSSYTTARYRANGSLDPAFGAGGTVVTPLSNRLDFGRSALIQPDGKILLAGHYFESLAAFNNFGVVRYRTNGSVDNVFGSGGLVSVDWDGGVDGASAIELQTDGKILVAGTTTDRSFTTRTFAMARLLGDSPVPAAARVDGQVTNTQGLGLGNARLTFTNLQSGVTRTVSTSPFGYYAVDDLPTGNIYQVRVSSKRHRFTTPLTFRLLGNINGLTIASNGD
jgi:uncharacterized delta-60 repeat protein